MLYIYISIGIASTPSYICVELLQSAMETHIKAGHIHFIIAGFPYTPVNWQTWTQVIGMYIRHICVCMHICAELVDLYALSIIFRAHRMHDTRNAYIWPGTIL